MLTNNNNLDLPISSTNNSTQPPIEEITCISSSSSSSSLNDIVTEKRESEIRVGDEHQADLTNFNRKINFHLFAPLN